MLSQVLREVNNHFVSTYERNSFNIVSDGIEGSFSHKYVVNQYICIDGSKINDDVYKITEITDSKLTLQGTLSPEVATIDLFGLAIPKAFLELVDAITAYNNKAIDGLSSESQGGRSVSFKNGSGWTEVFKSRLKAYRCSFSDKNRFIKGHYNIRTKGYE